MGVLDVLGRICGGDVLGRIFGGVDRGGVLGWICGGVDHVVMVVLIGKKKGEKVGD